MSKELVKKETSILAEYSTEQVGILKTQIAKGASDDQLLYFLNIAKAKKLNPFANQIFCVVRNTKQEDGSYKPQIAIQTGIDGFRAIASRSGELAGIDDVIYDKEIGIPTKASVTVHRMIKGQKVSFTATARWAEFFPGEKMGFLWKQKPFLMLGKCAEAQALRKAFPEETGSLYVEEEMEQKDYLVPNDSNADKLKAELEGKKDIIEIVPEKKIGKVIKAQIEDLAKKKGKEVSAIVSSYKHEKIEDFTVEEAKKVLTQLNVFPDKEEIVPKTEEKEIDPEDKSRMEEIQGILEFNEDDKK